MDNVKVPVKDLKFGDVLDVSGASAVVISNLAKREKSSDAEKQFHLVCVAFASSQAISNYAWDPEDVFVVQRPEGPPRTHELATPVLVELNTQNIRAGFIIGVRTTTLVSGTTNPVNMTKANASTDVEYCIVWARKADGEDALERPWFPAARVATKASQFGFMACFI